MSTTAGRSVPVPGTSVEGQVQGQRPTAGHDEREHGGSDVREGSRRVNPTLELKRAGTGAVAGPGQPPSVKLVIIREIYDVGGGGRYFGGGGDAGGGMLGDELTVGLEKFEAQLESALSNSVETIVIEPIGLGTETHRWILVGNCLHKTAVLSGLASIVSGFIWPNTPLAHGSLSALSFLTAGIYTLSWATDPCSKYQVEGLVGGSGIPSGLSLMTQLSTLKSSSPVVLVRKNTKPRLILQTLTTLSALSLSALRTLPICVPRKH